MTVVSGGINGAAHTSAAISPTVAVGVVTGGAALERRERCVDDALSVRVLLGLEASVSNFLDTVEVELLGKVETAPVRSIGDVERESDVVQPVRGSFAKLPSVSDYSKA